MALRYLEAILDWCKIKIPLADKEQNSLFNEGEIWWCSIGMNVGGEEFGKGEFFARPVLIFKKFDERLFLGLPLSGHEKIGDWYQPITVQGKEGAILFNQARTLDEKRLGRKIVTMTEPAFLATRERFHELYCPQTFPSYHPALLGEDRWVAPKCSSSITDELEKSKVL